jgi:Fuc2NAc and GlcNAc transferase
VTSRLLLGVVVAAVLSWAGALALSRWAERLSLIDVPNKRSSHSRPIPRGGGAAFVAASTALTLLASLLSPGILPAGSFPLLSASLVVALAGLADDRWQLPAGIRLMVQLGAAVYVVEHGVVVPHVGIPGGGLLPLGRMAAPLCVLWLVASTNAYNFMDGIDGLVAGQSVVIGLVLCWMSDVAGAVGLALAIGLLAGAIFGFLLCNWPPARIFMGDVGSGYLGFVFAGWAIIGARPGEAFVPLGAWLIAGAPLLFDAAFTLIFRALHGERIYEPHRKHLYQRLIRLGWSHRQVTTLYLVATAITGTLTVLHYTLGAISAAPFLVGAAMPVASIPVIVWLSVRAQGEAGPAMTSSDA